MRSIFGAIFVLSSAVPALAAGKDIVDTTAAAGFKTLVAAVRAADLVDTLKGSSPFTVFAPTDEAFAKLPAGMLEALLKAENKENLQSILTYHVVAGRSMAADVVKLDGKNVETVQGGRLGISVEGGTVRIGKATVIKADVATSNGVIHMIDTVLLPPACKRAESPKPSTFEIHPKRADGDAPLAQGFPAATNPGAVEVKKHPAYCSAVAHTNKAGVSSGNMLFFSLFKHIQRNRIEMTALVINTY
jgi:uncharacterized surface protein with fasciclin (FAS1) repeats